MSRHDALNELVRRHPELPIRLLRQFGGIDLPTEPLTVGPGDLRDRVSREMHADTIVLAGPRQDRWFSTIVEVETEMSEEKLRQTVVAAATLWLQTRKPVYVVFLTPDPDAGKFAHPVEVTSGHLTLTMYPVIVGPGHIPVLTDPQAMAADPLMAALSVMAHGLRPEVVEAFAKMLADLPDDHAMCLYSYTVDMAPPQARHLLEETVPVYIPQHSPWLQHLYREGFAEGEAKGRAEGEAKGRAEGEAKGRAEGEAKGRAEAGASSVLTVLRFRGIDIPPARERQISTCTDADQINRWLQRALDATHIDDLFDDTPGAAPRS